jgi:ubiquitin-conjugating enzyme E2 variant
MSVPFHDDSRSTWPQRALTLAGTAAILSSALTCARLLAATGSATEPFAAAAAAFAGYSLADLSNGVYHWFIDNYGGATTPVIGAQVASFLDHHRRPSAITRLEPCCLLHTVASAVAVTLPAAGAVLTARGAPAAAHAFACAFAACAMLSVQIHAWAHETPARLPPGVGALQSAGVLLSRAKHGGHHRPPHNSDYCSVSGMWNPVLDRYRAFQKVEKLIYLGTGVRPRSWGEVDGARPPWSKLAASDDDDGEHHQLR